jgi:death-on-curing protein
LTGAGRGLDYLSLDDLLEIAEAVIGNVSVRDLGLLESCAARPRTTVLGEDAYPRLVDKAAALLHAPARNHPLVDGNKRLAWSATRAFLPLNAHDLSYSVDDAEALVIGVATGTQYVSGIARWLAERLVPPA